MCQISPIQLKPHLVGEIPDLIAGNPRRCLTGQIWSRGEFRWVPELCRSPNRTLVDAVVSLKSEMAPRTLLAMLFLGASKSILLDRIGPGSHIASIEAGTDWDAPKMRFRRRISFHQTFSPIRFLQVESSAGVTSNQRELVIEPEDPSGIN